MEQLRLAGDEPTPDLPISVVRSKKRKKTSSARIVDGVIEVRVPSWLSAQQERAVVADLVARVTRARELAEAEIDLEARSAELADRYDLPLPARIRWVGNQQRRWASCTPSTGEIRISSRLRKVPRYVLDYVIVHELAHLVEPGHGPGFRAIERRFPRWERAEGFLEAMDLGVSAPQHRSD